MYGAEKSIWLIPIAVVPMAYANVVLKLRIIVLGGGDSSASWLSYLISMMFDPWTWSARLRSYEVAWAGSVLLAKAGASVLPNVR